MSACRQIAAPGFFPSIGRRLVGSDRTDARIDRVLKMIADRPEINTVIFSAAWADYARGSNWKGQRWLYQDDLGAARDAAGNVPVFARSLARIIDALPRHQIILLDDVPAGLELDLRFFVRRSMLQSFDRTDAVLPQEDADDRRSAYAPTLRKIAADRNNVLFIPVFEDFCWGLEGCPLFAADMATPIYRDGDHLSNYGALSWSEPFRKRVLSQIGARFSAN